MNVRCRWPMAALILFLAWLTGPAIAKPTALLVLAEQTEPVDAQAERLRRRSRDPGYEQDASETDSEQSDSRDHDQPDTGTLDREPEHGGRDREPRTSDSSQKPGDERAGSGHGQEVSGQMLDNRDERKAIMEGYRESGEKVTGKKPWFSEPTGAADRGPGEKGRETGSDQPDDGAGKNSQRRGDSGKDDKGRGDNGKGDKGEGGKGRN